MALENVLTPDGDIREIKMALTRSLRLAVTAAEDWAKASLGAANEVIKVASEGGPCAAAYTSYAEIGEFHDKAKRAVGNITDLTNILLAVNESADDEANDAYSDHLAAVGRVHEIGAILEGAATRLEMINRALPENPQPAARFNPSVFASKEES